MSNNYYLKVAFQHKIKKYSIHSPAQINFTQIKLHLGLTESTKDSLFYYQLVHDFTTTHNDTNQVLKEEELIQHLTGSVIQSNSTIKLRILQRTLMSEQQKRRKESYESLEIPTTFEKKRSKSMEFQIDVFDQTCQTECFDQTNSFIVPSPKQLNSQSSSENKQKSSAQPSTLSDLQNRKIFSKSAQICISSGSSFIYQNPKLLNSVCCQIDLNKIRNSLQQSMRVTEQQKGELLKLKDKIARREKQKLIQKQRQRNQLNDVLMLFGIQAKTN